MEIFLSRYGSFFQYRSCLMIFLTGSNVGGYMTPKGMKLSFWIIVVLWGVVKGAHSKTLSVSLHVCSFWERQFSSWWGRLPKYFLQADMSVSEWCLNINYRFLYEFGTITTFVEVSKVPHGIFTGFCQVPFWMYILVSSYLIVSSTTYTMKREPSLFSPNKKRHIKS